VNNKCFFIIICFLFSTTLISQIVNEKKPLSDVLAILQDRYNYQFSYANDVIENVSVKLPSSDLTFIQAVDYLRKNIDLEFKILKNNFVLISLSDLSFTICGIIFERETKSPIEGVTIVSKTSATTTNSKGYFELKVKNKSDEISISHLGFQLLVKPVSFFESVNCANIFLNSEIEVLQEVVLTNLIAKGIDKNSDGSFKINITNFDIVPGLLEKDVLFTIQVLPGIQSVDETVSNINIRGGTHDQNLIKWDEIKMYQSGHFFGLISMFNPLITSDVTVIKNGTDADLTDGISGSILMKTDTLINDTFSGSIGANFISIDGFTDIPISNNSSLQLAARKAINDLVETPTYNSYFERISQDTEAEESMNSEKKFDFYDASVRWLYQISDKDFIRVSGLLVNNELVFNENGTLGLEGVTKESNLIQNSIGGSIFYKRNWSKKFTSTLKIYESDYKLKAVNSDIKNQQRLLQENEVSETSAQLNTQLNLNNKLSLFSGYQFTETAVSNLTDVDNPTIVKLVREVIREHGLYSQLQYKSKRTALKVGLRYNFIEKFNKHIIEPRVVLNYMIFNHFIVELSGEFKHQNTSQIINFQNDFLGIEKRRWRLSNNIEVPVITSEQASIGLNYSNSGWLISAELFIKDVDGITSQSQGFLNQYIFEQEIGSYQVYGIDFLINKRINKFNSWLTYTYAINEYSFPEFKEVYFPSNFDIKHAVSFGTTFSTNNLKISTGINWHTGIPTTKPVIGNEIVNGEINYEDANSSRLDDYLRIDVSAIYHFKLYENIHANVGVSVLNIFDKENIISNFYRIENNIVEEVSRNSLGLTPNAILRISF